MNPTRALLSAIVATTISAATTACTTSVIEPLPEPSLAALVAAAGAFKFVSCNSDALCAPGQYCAVDIGSTWGRCKIPGRNGFTCASNRDCDGGFSCTNIGGPYSETFECRSNQNRPCVTSRECGKGLVCARENSNYSTTLSCQSLSRGRACQLDEDCGASSCIVGIYQEQGICN
jgi:hypothetical protein